MITSISESMKLQYNFAYILGAWGTMYSEGSPWQNIPIKWKWDFILGYKEYIYILGYKYLSGMGQKNTK